MPNRFRYQSGLGRADAYVVSGRPFASGSLSASATAPLKIEFPSVTRWVQIQNHDPSNTAEGDLKCAFSRNGLPSAAGTNYFTLQDRGSSTPGHNVAFFELKVTEMWFEDSAEFDVVAGLTTINVNEINTSGSMNWSGSAGVG